MQHDNWLGKAANIYLQDKPVLRTNMYLPDRGWDGMFYKHLRESLERDINDYYPLISFMELHKRLK